MRYARGRRPRRCRCPLLTVHLHTVMDLAPPSSTPRGPLPSRRRLKSSPHLLDSSTPPSVSRFSDVSPSL
ncbi:hypothetical protein PVAP13_5NG012912 [Panicum virgatum]|uniref:Uncharacterized protein n=1 Tax=Panicum virgatum TaxID=38727 RepID=A0A8T0RLX2_PANVG|nr:hypothetical protein PVAP13_5NG012912 [Panicum virgatum]